MSELVLGPKIIHARGISFLLRRAGLPEHGKETLCGVDGFRVTMLDDPGPEKHGWQICKDCRNVLARYTAQALQPQVGQEAQPS